MRKFWLTMAIVLGAVFVPGLSGIALGLEPSEQPSKGKGVNPPELVRPATRTIIYTVKKGDKLWDISKRFLKDGTKWRSIARENDISIHDARRVEPGTKLKITVPVVEELNLMPPELPSVETDAEHLRPYFEQRVWQDRSWYKELVQRAERRARQERQIAELAEQMAEQRGRERRERERKELIAFFGLIFVVLTILTVTGWYWRLVWRWGHGVTWLHLIPCFIVASFLFASVVYSDSDWGHGRWLGLSRRDFGQLVRVITTAVAVLCCYRAVQWRRRWALWLFAGLAVLFNPFLPAKMSDEIWSGVAGTAGVLFVVGSVWLEAPEMERHSSRRWKVWMTLVLGVAALIGAKLLVD